MPVLRHESAGGLGCFTHDLVIPGASELQLRRAFAFIDLELWLQPQIQSHRAG